MKEFIIKLLVRNKAMRWLMREVIPYIRFTTYYALPSNPRFNKWGQLVKRLEKVARPGDFLLTVDKRKLTTALIGAFASDDSSDFNPSHAAQIVAIGEDFEAAEMTHTDYTKSTIGDVCYESTRLVLMRCDDYDQEYIDKKVVPTCLSFEEKKYDTDFEHGIEDLACSELVYFSDPERRLVVDLTPLVGKIKYISPIGLYKAKNCQVIWDSNKEW